jgi:cbb3-type cytochrome oxidase maturation protein
MESLFFLLPLSVLIICTAVGVLIWAIGSGQYDDLDGAADRFLLMEDNANSVPNIDTQESEESPADTTL